MRAFIAIDIPVSVKEKIEGIETTLKKCDLNAKWVNPQNIHLTLKFLGNIEEKQLDEIKKAVSETASSFSPLETNLKEFGFFPNEKRPRVFFISTDKEEILKKIAYELEERLEKIGFTKENRFKAHITLSRFKDTKNIDCLKKEVKNIKLQGNLAVKEITLYKSTLTSRGPVYEVIFSAGLGL